MVKSKVRKDSKQHNQSAGSVLKLPRPLKPSQVFHACKPSELKFTTTKKLPSTHEIFAQERAIEAINAGLGIRRPGYNIYVAGVEGTGKTSVIQTFLQKWSKHAQAPNDWLYLYNFADNERPKAVALPRGIGRKFKKAMEQLVRTFKEEIPLALQSADYENAVNALYSAANEAKSKLYTDLEKKQNQKTLWLNQQELVLKRFP